MCVQCVVLVLPYSMHLCLFVNMLSACVEGITNNVILAGSGRDTEGYVMIFRSSSWHFLVASSTYWTDTHAGVVCRQLGYSGGVVPSDTSGYRWGLTVYSLQLNVMRDLLVNPSWHYFKVPMSHCSFLKLLQSYSIE